MIDSLKYVPHAFIPIFVAIDIFAVLPIFLAMTRDLSMAKKDSVINESIITALFVAMAFIGLGEGIFRVLHITDNDFKVAGGLVLLIFAILDLVRHGDSHRKAEMSGVVPMGVPLIVGPAVLTTLLVLVDHYGVLATVISLLLNLAIVWVSFKKGTKLVKILGDNGILAISKVMALLLASIAVMMIRLGIANIIIGKNV